MQSNINAVQHSAERASSSRVDSAHGLHSKTKSTHLPCSTPTRPPDVCSAARMYSRNSSHTCWCVGCSRYFRPAGVSSCLQQASRTQHSTPGAAHEIRETGHKSAPPHGTRVTPPICICMTASCCENPIAVLLRLLPLLLLLTLLSLLLLVPPPDLYPCATTSPAASSSSCMLNPVAPWASGT